MAFIWFANLVLISYLAPTIATALFAVGLGLLTQVTTVGGFYLAFSLVVMPALRRLRVARVIARMIVTTMTAIQAVGCRMTTENPA